MTLCDYDIVREQSETESDLTDVGIPNRPPLIEPFIMQNVQPASVDLTLGDEFLRYPSIGQDLDPTRILKRKHIIALDQVKTNPVKMDRIQTDRLLLEPGGFVLGRTREWVNIPAHLVASVEGKSSLARLGLFVHVTAGFIDPGFRGTMTLEFYNGSPRVVELVAGVRICQIAFMKLSRPCARPYGTLGLESKYQNQAETVGSRYAG